MKNKGFSLIMIFFICVGIIVGTLTANLTSSVSWLNWLSYGLDFGVAQPFVLDLYILKLTFGLIMHLNISVIIFTIIFGFIGYFAAKKMK